MINFSKETINFYYYDVCVSIMKHLAKLTNTTYEEINLIVFVIIHPTITLIFLLLLLKYYYKYKKLSNII